MYDVRMCKLKIENVAVMKEKRRVEIVDYAVYVYSFFDYGAPCVLMYITAAAYTFRPSNC